jgi:hypothetical protein
MKGLHLSFLKETVSINYFDTFPYEHPKMFSTLVLNPLRYLITKSDPGLFILFGMLSNVRNISHVKICLATMSLLVIQHGSRVWLVYPALCHIDPAPD